MAQVFAQRQNGRKRANIDVTKKKEAVENDERSCIEGTWYTERGLKVTSTAESIKNKEAVENHDPTSWIDMSRRKREYLFDMFEQRTGDRNTTKVS